MVQLRGDGERRGDGDHRHDLLPHQRPPQPHGPQRAQEQTARDKD